MNNKLNLPQTDSEDIQNNELLEEMIDVDSELENVTSEKEHLEKYLHSNIFNFVEARDNLDDIFAIQDNALAMVDELNRGHLRLDRTIPLLEVRHLTKYYPDSKIPAVVNANFKVYAGDFHILVGSNGSGKTTIMNAIMEQTDGTYDGEILVANKNVFTEPKSVWSKYVDFVPEHLNFEPNKLLIDILTEVVTTKSFSRLRAVSYVRNSLEEFNLWHLRNKKFVELNLLEKRKLGLSIALINQPKLIILDEPLSGLQLHEKIDLLFLLAKLQKEERGILALSHQIDEFSGYANFMTIISNGKVFYSGLIENLELHNMHKFTIRTSDNELALNLLKNVNCRFKLNEVANNILVKFDDRINLLIFQKECASKNVVITDLRHAAISLEDLYSVLLKVGTGEAIRKIHEYQLEQAAQNKQR